MGAWVFTHIQGQADIEWGSDLFWQLIERHAQDELQKGLVNPSADWAITVGVIRAHHLPRWRYDKKTAQWYLLWTD